MNDLEKTTVKMVAKAAPWLAPLPSAYFVARASMEHLGLPLVVAVIAAAIIETLGLSTVHSALWLSDYNAHKRKTDPTAPTWIALALGAVYIVATVGLVVVLEVWPFLATYAPALFPLLAVVGAMNLALIAQQERREAAIQADKKQRKIARQGRRQARRETTRKAQHAEPSKMTSHSLDFDTLAAKARQVQASNRNARLDALLTFYLDAPDAGPTEAGRAIGVSRQTIYSYLDELEAAGKVRKNGHGVEVLELGR